MYKKWIKSNILDIIQVMAIVGAGVTGIVVWLQNVPWYLVVLGVLFAVVLVITGINQYDIRKERYKKKLTQLSDKELENTIHDWITTPAWSVQPQTVREDALFAYLIQHQDFHVAVVRYVKEPSVIVLASKLTIRSKKTALSEPEWNRLGGQLSIELARLGIEWDFVGSPTKFETIQLLEPVILDDLVTGYYFRSRVMFMVRAGILVLEVWKEALRLSEKSVPHKADSQL